MRNENILRLVKRMEQDEFTTMLVEKELGMSLGRTRDRWCTVNRLLDELTTEKPEDFRQYIKNQEEDLYNKSRQELEHNLNLAHYYRTAWAMIYDILQEIDR